MDVYQHYKGGLYEILHSHARMEEDGHPPMVVYRQLSGGKVFVRPQGQFFEMFKDPATGEIIQRFKRLWSS